MTTQELIDILDPHFEVVPYSGGRGMEHGQTCVSIRLNGSQWDEACFREIRGLPGHHHDSLGKGKVIYWPEYELSPKGMEAVN